MTTVRDAFRSYAIASRAEGLSPRTIGAVAHTVDLFTQRTPTELEDITRDEVRLFLANPRWSQATRLIHWKSLKTLFDFAISEGMLKESPLTGVHRPQKAAMARRPPIYSEDDIESLLSACPEWRWCGLRDRAVLSVLLTTPARLSEVCRLRLEDIDWESNRLILHGKGGTTYACVLFPECARALDRYIRRRPFDRPYMFISRDGKPLSAHTLQLMLHRIRDRSGLDKPVYAHAFRHRFGMNTVRWGLATDEAMYAMGHRSDHATKLYRQWFASEQALEKISRIAG